MKIKIFRPKTNRYQRRYNMPYIPKILNMSYDSYWAKFKSNNVSNHHKENCKFNKRLKFYWAKWHQLRNKNLTHGFKNHFKKQYTQQDKQRKIKEIEAKINKYANRGLYSVNCYEVKFLYQQLRELKNEPIKDTNNYQDFFIDGSDVPKYSYYE